jgi:aspartate-semialdehyde dehydrogenase
VTDPQPRRRPLAGLAPIEVALVGATDAAGQEVIAQLIERDFPVRRLRLLTGHETLTGEEIAFRGTDLREELLSEEAFTGVDIAIFAGNAIDARRWGRAAARAGAVVIDATGTFAREAPVIVPEVNPQAIPDRPDILASPSPTTVALALALDPLHAAAGVRRVVVSTYEAASGLGRAGMDELSAQSRAVFSADESEPDLFPHRLAFNLIPHTDAFETDGALAGSTREEARLATETPRILGSEDMGVSATAVRVPVFVGVALSVNVALERPLSLEKAREEIASAPGLRLIDEPAFHLYPLPAEVAGRDDVFVGRMRADPTVPHGLNLWIVADDLRRGVGINVVGIAEAVLKRRAR